MDSDDAMVAPAASELVGDELDQDHELCLWGDELGNAHRRARMQLLKLAMAAWNANVLAEMKAIATANDYGVFYDYGCIDGMNGEYPAWESQADWHKDTSHENAPPIVIARELLLWGCAKSAGDVDAEQCANYLAHQEEYMALHIAHNMAEPPGPEPPSDDGATWQDLYGDSPPGSPAPGSAQFGGGDDFDHHEELQLWGVVLQGAFLLQQEADQHAWEWMNVRAQATLAGIEHQAYGEDHDIVAVMEFWGQGMHHPSSPTQHLANVCNCVVANGVAVVCQIHENSEEQVQLFEAYVQSTHLACELHYCACDASIAYLEEGEGFPEVAARLWQAESPQESLGRAEAEF